VLHFPDQDGVAEMEIGSGGIEADFDAQGAAFAAGLDEPLAEILFADQFGEAFLYVGDLLVNRKPGHP
jgi:hypothetical protein